MQPDEIQPELRAFVVDRIHSVAQLELLLLLRRDASKPWTAAELHAARRVTVITPIDTEPVDKLQPFADAFRFSRDQKKEVERPAIRNLCRRVLVTGTNSGWIGLHAS